MAGNIETQRGLKLLKKYDMEANIQTNSEGMYLRSIGTFDSTKRFNLKMSFKGLNFLEMLINNQFKAFEISGENLISVSSDFEGISIPSSGNILSIKVIPVPVKKTKVSLYFKGTDLHLSDIDMEYFKGYNGKNLLRFTHKSIVMDIEDSENKFNFKLLRFNNLRELEDSVAFLLELVLGIDSLYIYMHEEQKEYEMLQMNPDENQTFIEQFREILELIDKLKIIQRHYRLNFNNFEVDFSEQTLELIHILYTDIKKVDSYVDTMYLSTKSLNFYEKGFTINDFIKKYVEGKEVMGIESSMHIDSASLFGATIPINKKLVLSCDDAIVISAEEKEDSSFEIEVKSIKKGIKRYLV